MKSQSMRKRFASGAVKWASAVLCGLVLFSYASYAAQAQPAITGFLVNGVSANSGPIGATLTIQGSGFGSTQGFSTATLNGTAVAGNGVKANSWSNTSIVVVIPANATSGTVVVKVGKNTSNGLNFTVFPAINALSPVSGTVGTSVTISGANFTTSQGNTVRFNGAATTPSSWSGTKIVAPVPWTTTGKVVVTVGGTQSNGVNFTIAAPAPTNTLRTGTFFVNRTDDPPVPVDATGNPLFSQFCQNTSSTDTSSPCSLREAIVSVNGDASDSSTSPDTIMLGSVTYHLSIKGTNTIDATTGHLDITNVVTIVGAGSATIIQADSTLQDQIFLIDAAEEGSIGFPVAISNLVMQGGQANPVNGAGATITSGGAFQWEAGTGGTGRLRLTNVTITGNTATDPTNPSVDDGGGMALFNTAGVTTPAQVTVTGSQILNNQAFDAGGGIALKGAISLNMSNSSVTGNKAVGGGIQQGGGLFILLANNPPPAGTSSPSLIQNSTISSNTAGSGGLGEGGGVWTNQSLTINQGSVINGNSAGATGGGVAIAVAGATDQVVISSSTISSNTSAGSGAGIEIDANTNSSATLQLGFNRIVGNSSNTAPSGVANQSSGTVTAIDNWWGCDLGPSTTPCDTVNAGVNASPFITLTNTASPNSVQNGATTTLTASVLQDSAFNTLSVSNLGPLIGLPVSWLNPVNGSLTNVQTTIQPNGTATASFTPNAVPTATAEASIDQVSCQGVPPGNCLSLASVKVQDFSVSVSSVTANIGSTSAALTVTVSSINGFNGVVTLACGTPLPSGITCPPGSFNPATVTGSGTSTLKVNIDPSVAPGTLSIPVTGTSSGIARGGSGNLHLATFSLSISPASQTILLSQTATYTVTCSSSDGFSGPVQLSSTLGGTSFNPNTINPCPGTSTLTVTPTTTGNPSVPVSGTFGNAPAVGASASLSVQDFSVSVSSVTVNIGSTTASLNVTVSSINGFNGVVGLACGTMPAGITCPSGSFTPPTVTGSGTSTLKVNIDPSVAPGTLSIPVTGTSTNSIGSVTRSGSGSLHLASFSLSISPASETILLTQTATYTVTCSSSDGFSGPVQLSSTLGGTSFNPNPINPCPGTSTLTVTPTTTGNPTVPVSGTFGNAPPVATSASLSIQDFSVSVSPATANFGSTSASLIVTVTSINGFNGMVNLACGTPLPNGITCPSGSFNPPTLTGSGTSTLKVNIDPSVAPGTLSIPVTGTSTNSIGSVTRGGSGNLHLASFSLSISPASQSILLSQTATYTVTCASSDGFSGPVQLSSSLGGTSFNPDPVNCPGTSQLHVTPTTAGNFNIPVSGTFGDAPPVGTSASLSVQDFQVSITPALQTITVGQTSGAYTVTVTPSNGFTGTVNFSCSIAPSPALAPTFSCPSSITISSGAVSFAVTLATTGPPSITPAQAYTFTVTGTASGLSRSGTATLKVQDLQLFSPGQSIFHVDVNQHVDLLFFNGTNWNFVDLTSVSGATNQASSSSALTTWFVPAGAFATYYQGTNQDVYELYFDGNAQTLTNGDVTAATGGVASAGGSGLSSFTSTGAAHATYYVGADQHVHELYWTGSAWANGDVSAATGGVLAASNSPTTTFPLNGGAGHATYYLGADQHVYELFWNGSAWTNGDLTAATGGTLALLGTGITSFTSCGNGHAVYYIGTNQHVYELFWSGSTWTNGDVSAATGGVLAAANSPLTMFPLNCGAGHATYYLGTNQHVYELFWNGSAWTNGDVSAATGAPLASTTSGLTSFTTNGPGHAVYFVDVNQHVNELVWNGSTWGNGDLTAVAGGTPASSNSALASFWHQ